MSARENLEASVEARLEARFDVARFSTAIPDARLNRELSASVSRLIKGLMIEMLENCEASLRIDLQPCKTYIVKLPDERKLRPEIFTIATHLQHGIAEQDADLVYDWLSRLARLAGRASHADLPLVSSVLSEYWEHASVAAMRKYDQTNIRGEKTIVWPILDEATMDVHRRNIDQALALIGQYDPDCYDEFDAFVVCIKLFQGQVLRGETSKMSYGAIWLRQPEPETDQVAYWIEHIVHEISHLRLEAVFMHEQLVLNPPTEKRFRAPIRDDPRPMRGVFHACFVLARIIRIFRRMSIAGYDKRFRDQLRLFELQFEIGSASVHDPAARLSENGIKIRDSLAPCCVS